jgi:REP element-mobilizing transposase RayT
MQTSCHTRKTPAHPPPRERHNTPVVVHVTVCASERRSIFDSPGAHAALRQAWEMAEQWRVAEYVIMPDHIHLFFAYPAYSRLNH